VNDKHRCWYNEFLKSSIPPFFRKDIDDYEKESGELFVDVCDRLDEEICREMNKPLALCCRQHRRVNKLTRKQLAKRVGVDVLTIKKVEGEKFSKIDCADKPKITTYFSMNAEFYPCDQFQRGVDKV